MIRARAQLANRGRDFLSSTLGRHPAKITTRRKIPLRTQDIELVEVIANIDKPSNRQDGRLRLPRHAAHAQVHSQPSACSQADGRVSFPPCFPRVFYLLRSIRVLFRGLSPTPLRDVRRTCRCKEITRDGDEFECTWQPEECLLYTRSQWLIGSGC